MSILFIYLIGVALAIGISYSMQSYKHIISDSTTKECFRCGALSWIYVGVFVYGFLKGVFGA